MSQELAVDIAKQEISSGYLEFFELEVGDGSNNVLFFHDGKNENADLNDPDRWTKDPALRVLSVTIKPR